MTSFGSVPLSQGNCILLLARSVGLQDYGKVVSCVCVCDFVWLFEILNPVSFRIKMPCLSPSLVSQLYKPQRTCVSANSPLCISRAGFLSFLSVFICFSTFYAQGGKPPGSCKHANHVCTSLRQPAPRAVPQTCHLLGLGLRLLNRSFFFCDARNIPALYFTFLLQCFIHHLVGKLPFPPSPHLTFLSFLAGVTCLSQTLRSHLSPSFEVCVVALLSSCCHVLEGPIKGQGTLVCVPSPPHHAPNFNWSLRGVHKMLPSPTDFGIFVKNQLGCMLLDIGLLFKSTGSITGK